MSSKLLSALDMSGAVKSQVFPHGGGIEAAAKSWQCEVSEVLDLSTGLHPAGQPVWLAAWLNEHADLVAHYPDRDGEPARTILAEKLGVAPENVLITAGAQAVIEVIFQAMDWQSLAICVPCYNEPIRCAQRAGCRVLAIELGAEIPPADALWWTSPSNPYGDKSEFPMGYSGVFDESYMVFSEREKLGVLENIVRLGSLTKTFCIPGLRLGYVVAEQGVIETLKVWLPPWPASTLSLHLLPALLAEAQQRDIAVKQGCERLVGLLKKYGWQVHPSQASFVLARPTAGMPDFSCEKILVRKFAEWPQLQGWVRFGLPHGENDWQRLEAALCLSL
ncbi:MAG: aminotransferase class I/II-fold pyridoxal phosphate-dependent enzyme [Mariprofundaceae bacterium]